MLSSIGSTYPTISTTFPRPCPVSMSAWARKRFLQRVRRPARSPAAPRRRPGRAARRAWPGSRSDPIHRQPSSWPAPSRRSRRSRRGRRPVRRTCAGCPSRPASSARVERPLRLEPVELPVAVFDRGGAEVPEIVLVGRAARADDPDALPHRELGDHRPHAPGRAVHQQASRPPAARAAPGRCAPSAPTPRAPPPTPSRSPPGFGTTCVSGTTTYSA